MNTFYFEKFTDSSQHFREKKITRLSLKNVRKHYAKFPTYDAHEEDPHVVAQLVREESDYRWS